MIQAIRCAIEEELDRENETLDDVRRTFRLPIRTKVAA